ncbi:MAG: TPM domain-containing protein, partial [Nitrospira sp. SB0667_bin_9]|nr:TPM domain-containing protein [Nitrospira sp. SB0667_bin_9]
MDVKSGLAVVLLLFLPALSWGEVFVPDPGTYVVDDAGIIDPGTEQQLEGWLRELEQKTTAQLKVLTVESTQGEPFFSFVQRHAEAWKLGRKGQDNGALIALALKERKVRIHTGYGLEGALPDSWVGSVSRAVASQFFKQAQYSQGLFQLAIVTANQIADAQRVTLTGIPQHRYRPSRGGGGGGSVLGSLLVPLFFLFMLFSNMRRRRRHYSTWGGGGMVGGMVGGML